MNGPIDYTGYGYSSGGFAPTPDDSAAARRNKAMMDRMSDYMQKLDPMLNRTLETLVRTQVRNGASPDEARRAAFGSTSGQVLSDTLLGLRKIGFLGQGNPIDYGRNVLQGVSGGGFSVDILGANGRSFGANQSVMGGGIISGQASMQMAKDLMTQLYGVGGSDPRQAYGHNMEQASMVFRKLAERGALGNVGTLKQYGSERGSAVAIDEKIANARRYEADPLIREALNKTSAETIDKDIAEATRKGDKQIATALSDIKAADSTFVMNDENTKRVAAITKETLKGLSNLKEIYGNMNNPQLLAQMESLTGIRITNQAESRKAANMTRNLIGAAEASGNDPAAVINAVMNRLSGLQGKVGAAFGEDLGEGGVRSEIGKRIAAGMGNANMAGAMTTEAAMRGNSAELGALGINVRPRSLESILKDDEQQSVVWGDQNVALSLASGLAETTFKKDASFTSAYRKALRDAKSPDANVRAAAESAMEELIQGRMGVGSEEFLQTEQGADALANANYTDLSETARIASASAARTDLSDTIMRKAKLGANTEIASGAFKGNLGVSGMRLLAGKSKEERDAQIRKFIEEGYLSEEQAAAVTQNMDAVTEDQFKQQIADVANSAGGGRSLYDTEVANRERDDKANRQQREVFSDGKDLSLKSIVNAILSDPEKNGLNTDTKRLFALEAMQKAGLAGDLAPSTRVNMSDGFDQTEMDNIRKAAGGELDVHTQLGFNSEAEMLEAQKTDKSVSRNIRRMLENSTDLISGGTTDDTYFANANQDDKIKDYAKRFELASKYGEMVGAEPGAVTESMKEIMATGKVRPGGVGMGIKADGYQAVYDNDGDTSEGWFNINWNDEKNNPEDKVHFKQAGRLSGMAAKINSKEEGADMIELNNMMGGEPLKLLEAQLEQYKDAQSRGAVSIDTKDAKGDPTRLNMSEEIQKLTDAIAKLKSDDGNKVMEEMTVKVMKVERQEPK